MRAVCPECGSKNVRFSRECGIAEKLRAIIGVHAVRCRDCRHRFNDSIWKVSSMVFAHCPQCYREEVGLWSLDDFRPRAGQRLLINFGARTYRCTVCRTHFVSFLPRRGKERQAATAAGDALSK